MNKSDKNQQERRKHKRVKKHFLLTYYDLANPTLKYSASQLKNISEGGMRIITSRSFDPGTHLAIELKTPFVSELICLEGSVLESKEEVKDIIYTTRLEFQDLPLQTSYVLKKIMDYLNQTN